MPLYDFECHVCHAHFEFFTTMDADAPPCPACGEAQTRRLISTPAFSVKGDQATQRIENRVKGYLKAGKFAEATRFADKAASVVKSDKVKRIAGKLHEKTGK